MQLFDTTFKTLFQQNLQALLPLLLTELEGLRLIPEPTELPATVRGVDLMARGRCRIGSSSELVDQIAADKQYIQSEEYRAMLLAAAHTFSTFQLSSADAEATVREVLERRHRTMNPFETYLKRRFEEGEAKGKVEGKAEGKAEGLAQAVLLTLQHKKIRVTDDLRARTLACSNLVLLARLQEEAIEGRIDELQRALAAA